MTGHLGDDFGDGWRVEQHVGIVSVCHGAGTLFALDAAAQLGHCPVAPERRDVIIMVTHIPHGLGPNAAAPDVTIGGNMGARPTGITRNHLIMLVENTLGQLIIVGAEGLGKAGDPFSRGLAGLLAQKIGDLIVVVGARGNPPANGIQFDPFLGYFGDVAVWLQKLQPLLDLFETMYIKATDDGMDGKHEILMRLLQFFEPRPRFHGELPIAFDTADVIVLIADAIEAQVDADAARGTFATHACGHRQDALSQHPIRGNGDHFGLALLIGANHKFIEIRAQKGFTTSEGHVKGSVAQAGKDPFPLINGEVIVRFAPDVAGAAFAIAAKAHTNHNGERFDGGPAKGAEGPVQW